MEILKVDKLEKSFRGKKVVKNLSFQVNKGEIMGLLGPNGAGKTTTIRIIMGIIGPDEGTVDFRPEISGANSKRKIGYLPEERGLYEDAKTIEVLEYLGNLKGMSRETAREKSKNWLAKLELDGHEDDKISELSKGMAQKVQFIASVLHEPELAILDEPFAGLDPVNQDLFRDIVTELLESGTTVLLSSHRMNMVEELCKRVFMIHEGKEVLNGNLEKIKEEFGKELVEIKFNGEGELLREKFGERISSLEIKDGSASFYTKKGFSPNEFLKELPNAVEVEEIKLGKPPLHDIFVAKAKGVSHE